MQKTPIFFLMSFHYFALPDGRDDTKTTLTNAKIDGNELDKHYACNPIYTYGLHVLLVLPAQADDCEYDDDGCCL